MFMLVALVLLAEEPQEPIELCAAGTEITQGAEVLFVPCDQVEDEETD